MTINPLGIVVNLRNATREVIVPNLSCPVLSTAFNHHSDLTTVHLRVPGEEWQQVQMHYDDVAFLTVDIPESSLVPPHDIKVFRIEYKGTEHVRGFTGNKPVSFPFVHFEVIGYNRRKYTVHLPKVVATLTRRDVREEGGLHYEPLQYTGTLTTREVVHETDPFTVEVYNPADIPALIREALNEWSGDSDYDRPLYNIPSHLQEYMIENMVVLPCP